MLVFIANYYVAGDNFQNVIWSDEGLLTDVWFILLGNMFVGPLVFTLDPDFLYKLYMRRKIIKEGMDCKLTQKEAHGYFEGDAFDMAERYSIYVTTLMLCVFFMRLIPISTVVGAISSTLMYWVDKYLILNRHKVPAATGSDLNYAMYQFYDFIILLIGVRKKSKN